MHEDLWAGVSRKLNDAHLYFEGMARSLQPPERTGMTVALQSAGTIIANPWQDHFYADVDTFLAKVRSVPEVIEACFGADCGSRVMKDWFDRLPPAEQSRRRTFSTKFRVHREAFRKHHLSNARNVSEHRRGFPNVEGRVVGPFGKVHVASPVNRIPDAETRCFSPGNAPDLPLWAATQSPQPIQPRCDQFTIGGKPLFDECRSYLQLACNLRDEADNICQQVHGSNSLTIPPSS
jgi:hypothetical protein